MKIPNAIGFDFAIKIYVSRIKFEIFIYTLKYLFCGRYFSNTK